MSCNSPKTEVVVTVTNPLPVARAGEMVEVSMNDVTQRLQLADTAQIIVLNAAGKQVPYQITYDEKVLFPANVEAAGSASYYIKEGAPVSVAVRACGKQYPERVDDVAWENDLVAFRTYGPALQKSGERAFGYDVWTKYNTSDPVVEARYNGDLKQGISYHVDHGNGLDCYKVGPTLGGGTAALMPDGNIIYPYCYKTQEILDNGPLRFTVKLTYNPLTVKNDTAVVETRIITLDTGSHLNKTVVTYDNLSQTTPIAAGIVLHEPAANADVVLNATDGYIAYADPTDNVKNNNGLIFVGIVCPEQVKEARALFFPEKEKKELRGGADGHALAISDYLPGAAFTYYWGAGWSKADIPNMEAWKLYLADYAKKVRHPLTVAVQ
jgi:hypothetical protein